MLACVAAALAVPLVALADPPEGEPDEASGEGASTEGESESGSEAGASEGSSAGATESSEATTSAPVMDLAAFVHLAEKGYPGVRAAEARIRAARAQLDEAWVTPYFQSWITAGFTLAPEARGSPIFSPDAQVPLSNPWQPVVGFDIQGVIPIWTFGKLGAARDAARAGIRAAESDRTRVRQQLVYDVRRAYFALQLSLDVQQMLREGTPQLAAAIERVDERLEAGDGDVDEMDRYRLAAALAEVEGRAAQVEHLERSSRAALRALTGVREFRVPECPIQVVDIELGELASYVSSAADDRPEVRMLEAAQRAREASLDVARAGFWPDIGLTYRFGINYAPGITDQTNPFVIDQANYMNIGMGVALRWSLDFWGQAYRVDRESALLDDVRARFEEARRGMELEVTDAYETVREARARERAFDRARRETRTWFIAAAQGSDLGTVQANDLIEAVRSYFTARYSHLQAIHDLDTALANLERVSARRLTERWEASCE